MTEVLTKPESDVREQTLTEALLLIDKGLGQLSHRELVSAVEATDLLLDVRSLLASSRTLVVEPASAN